MAFISPGSGFSFPAIQSIGADVLAGFYAARSSQVNAATAQALSVQRGPAATTPWDVGTTVDEAEARLRSALAGGSFINEQASVLSGETPSEAETKLFTLYNGLVKLADIAGFASDKTTSQFRLNGLDRLFTNGLSEVLDYASAVNLEELAVLAGTKKDKMDAGIAVPSGLSTYTSKIIHNATTLTPMDGLTGSEVFTIQVAKSSGTTDIDIDLSELGTPNAVLFDDVVDLINTKLEAAGMGTRVKRERIVSEADEDAAVPPQTWALKIEGTSTETLSFNAAVSGPAVYVSGITGKPGAQAGQFLRLDASGAEPVIAGSGRIEPENVEENQAKSTAIALDSQGNSYVVSTTDGDIGTLANKGETDTVLSKFDSTGQLVWTRMLGAAESAEGFAVTVDADDNVIVAGKATGSLTGGSTIGTNANAFVTKFDKSGQEEFTRHLGPFAEDGALAVTTDADGNIYYGGHTKGAMGASQSHGGGEDAFITKLTSTGTLEYHRQFGASGNERITGLAVASDGNIVALANEDDNAVVYKFDAADGASAALWSQDLGDLGTMGDAAALKVSGGTVYVGGTTTSGSVGGGTIRGSYQGGTDGFVAELDEAAGSLSATTFVGGASTDRIRGVAVENGNVYVTGDTTADLGAGFSGTINAFTAKLDGAGGFEWVHQYAGREGQARASAVAVDPAGSSVLDVLGLPRGQLEYSEARSVTAQSSVRAGDEFFISVNGGAKRKIRIDGDESLNSLRFKIDRVLLFDGSAKVRRIPGGASSLRLEVKDGSRIDLFSGAEGKDALKGLGLEPGAIVDTPSLLDEPSEDDGPIYVALELLGGLTLKERSAAANASSALQDALSAIRKAHRELTKDPALEALLNDRQRASGPVPSYLSAQLANYQAGLDRLAFGGSSTLGLF